MTLPDATSGPDVPERQPELPADGTQLHDVGGVLLPRPFKIRGSATSATTASTSPGCSSFTWTDWD